jgi:hypothetical protein
LREITRLLAALRLQRAKVQNAIEAFEALSETDTSIIEWVEERGAIGRREMSDASADGAMRNGQLAGR